MTVVERALASLGQMALPRLKNTVGELMVELTFANARADLLVQALEALGKEFDEFKLRQIERPTNVRPLRPDEPPHDNPDTPF